MQVLTHYWIMKLTRWVLTSLNLMKQSRKQEKRKQQIGGILHSEEGSTVSQSCCLQTLSVSTDMYVCEFWVTMQSVFLTVSHGQKALEAEELVVIPRLLSGHQTEPRQKRQTSFLSYFIRIIFKSNTKGKRRTPW